MTLTQVRENQETRLKPYFAELEMNIKEKLTIAEKRREEVASDLLNISTVPRCWARWWRVPGRKAGGPSSSARTGPGSR